MPELRDYPDEYLFEPWQAPIAIQRSAGCLVGMDYPEPLLDHIQQRKICIQRMKDSLAKLAEPGADLSVVVVFAFLSFSFLSFSFIFAFTAFCCWGGDAVYVCDFTWPII